MVEVLSGRNWYWSSVVIESKLVPTDVNPYKDIFLDAPLSLSSRRNTNVNLLDRSAMETMNCQLFLTFGLKKHFLRIDRHTGRRISEKASLAARRQPTSLLQLRRLAKRVHTCRSTPPQSIGMQSSCHVSRQMAVLEIDTGLGERQAHVKYDDVCL